MEKSYSSSLSIMQSNCKKTPFQRQREIPSYSNNIIARRKKRIMQTLSNVAINSYRRCCVEILKIKLSIMKNRCH